MLTIVNIKKRGQLKIQEMAFVLLAIIVLFALVFLIFVAFQSRQYSSYAIMTREARAVTMLESIAAMPELRCSSSFSSTSEAVCVDKDKVNAFNSSLTLQNNYRIIWQNSLISSIIIEEVYPASGKKYVIYKASQQPASYRTYSTFVALCEEMQISRTFCTIAKIKATMEMPEVK